MAKCLLNTSSLLARENPKGTSLIRVESAIEKRSLRAAQQPCDPWASAEPAGEVAHLRKEPAKS